MAYSRYIIFIVFHEESNTFFRFEIGWGWKFFVHLSLADPWIRRVFRPQPNIFGQPEYDFRIPWPKIDLESQVLGLQKSHVVHIYGMRGLHPPPPLPLVRECRRKFFEKNFFSENFFFWKIFNFFIKIKLFWKMVFFIFFASLFLGGEWCNPLMVNTTGVWAP